MGENMKAIAALSLLILVSSATAAPFYQENFNFDSFAVPQNDALNQAGWKALVPGLRVRKFGNLKVSPGIVRNAPCYNSFPSGPEDGYSLWTKVIDGLTVFSEEYSFSVDSLSEASYLQRLSGYAADLVTYDGTRLALKIRSSDNSEKWYISDSIARQKKLGAWEEVNFSPKTISYAIVQPTGEVGPPVPAAGNNGNPLPANGVVTGFGVFIDRMNGRVRLDNFTLSDDLASNGIAPQPTPTRRPGPQPTIDNPDPEPDITPQPDGTVPPGATVSPTPTRQPGINVSYNFCTASRRATRRIKMSRSAAAVVLRKIKGTSAKVLRNRVIVEIVLKRKIRASSLENVRVSDFYREGTASYLNVYGTERKAVRLTRLLAKRVSNYMRRAGVGGEPQSPLFRVFTRKGVITTSAVCQKELSKVVTSAIRKARVRR